MRRSLAFKVGLAFLLAIAWSVAAQAVEIKPGHAGHWFGPERSGEGWVLEMIAPDTALLYWFTYDETGKQRWMTAVGQVVADDQAIERIEFPQLVVTRGGRFGPDFDPAQVVREDVGEAQLRFQSCDAGEFSYAAFGQAQTISVVRLAQQMGGRCESLHGVPGRVVAAHAGQSGSWFDTRHSGEGYSLQWMSPDTALLTWYSYDAQGNQYWMLGVGQFDASGRLHFPDLHATRGARFGAAFDPDDVERFLWGQLTLELGCDGGPAQYASAIAAFGNGDFDLTRLTSPYGIACPWTAPSLTDLYEVSFRQLPIAQGNPMNPNRIEARAITDDGTVVAVRGGEPGYTVLVLEEDAEDWMALPMNAFARDITVAPDGGIHASLVRSIHNDVVAMRWRRDTGEWTPLPNPAGFNRSFVLGGSARGTSIVGRAFYPNDPAADAWRTNAVGDLSVLQFNDDIPFGDLFGASETGDIVVGRTLRPGTPVWRPAAIRLVGGGNPEILRDTSGIDLGRAVRCNLDCSLIFGTDQAVPTLDHPNARQAWYWKPNGQFGYLGRMEEEFPFLFSAYNLLDVTDDGTMAVGDYITSVATSEAFIWTQDTGLVSVAEVLETLEIESSWTIRTAIGVSSTGDRIVLAGEIQRPNTTTHMQAAVLTLTPR